MDPAPRARRIPAPLAWLAGVAAVALGAGIGELAARFLAPASSPVGAVGAALIDIAPPWAKDAAITLFGTGDKIALLTGMGIVLVLAAALAGWLEVRKPPAGVVLVGAVGAAGSVVAATRPDAGPLSWIPSLVAGAVAVATLAGLVGVLRGPAPARYEAPTPSPGTADALDASASASGAPPPATASPEPARSLGPSRRAFFAWAGAATAAGILAALASQVRLAGSAVVTAAREALRLPAPVVAAAPVPAGAELGIPDLAPVVTPNDSFYRIDTALIVPEIDPAQWKLRVHGMVAQEFELTWDELLALPLEESWTTLACVSNEVGGTLIGNARWLGYPVRELLARAGPGADADMVLSRSIDGFSASTPLEALTDARNAILAIGMNGEPLPLQHGFPVRMVVPGLYGYVSATKWLVELEVTRFDKSRAYWTDRGWSERGPIKLQSRIDVPRAGQGLSAGDTVIAGVAWQQHVGITGVEVQIDEGPWQPATLATAISDDTWVQWSMPWAATAGEHLIRCRAAGKDGAQQTADRAAPAPDGATGWHERRVQIT